MEIPTGSPEDPSQGPEQVPPQTQSPLRPKNPKGPKAAPRAQAQEILQPDFLRMTAPLRSLPLGFWGLPSLPNRTASTWSKGGSPSVRERVFLDHLNRYLGQAEREYRLGNYEGSQELVEGAQKLIDERIRTRKAGWEKALKISEGKLLVLEKEIQFQRFSLGREMSRVENLLAKAEPKERAALEERINQLRNGQFVLKHFDRQIKTPSLAHTNLRNYTRQKIIQAFLWGDEEKYQQAVAEIEVLAQVMKREELVGEVFEELTRQFPGYSALFGETDFSKKTQEELNQWAQQELGREFAQPGMFEPSLKTLQKTPFSKKFKKIYDTHLYRAGQIKRGLGWVLQGETRALHDREVRKTLPDLTRRPENHFRFPVEKNADYKNVKLWLEDGEKEIRALQKFLQEISQEEILKAAKSDPTGKVNYFLSQRSLGENRLAVLGEIEGQGRGIALKAVRRDFLTDLNRLEEFYQNEFDRLKKAYRKNHPEVDLILLREDSDWEEALKQGLPILASSNPLELINAGSVEKLFNTHALGFVEGARQFWGLRYPAKASNDFREDWSALQRAYQALNQFRAEKRVWQGSVLAAETFADFEKVYRPIQSHQEKFLHKGLSQVLKQAEFVAKRGGEWVPLSDQVSLGRYKVAYDEIQKISDPTQRLKKINQLAFEIQDFVFGITLEQELAMVKELRKSDFRWGAIKSVAGYMAVPGRGLKDYYTGTAKAFGPYQDQIRKAQKLFKQGKVEKARKIYNSLGQSKQRKIIIERGQSSARWSGLVVGIGIVAASALTAGAVTGALLPVGAEGLSLALSVGRFTLNATTFWATDRALNSWVYREPFLGKSATTSGKVRELSLSWFENLLFFGTLHGVSATYQRLLTGVLRPGAVGLATQEGKIWTQLKPVEQAKYFQRYYQNLSRLSKGGIWVGQEAATLMGLNAYCSVTQEGYDAFSWDTQADILLFIGGLKVVSPLSTRLIEKIDLRKVQAFTPEAPSAGALN